MAEQGGAFGQVLRLDKKSSECRVGDVSGRRRQDDLGITRDVDLADTHAVIRHPHPAHFDVVFRRDRDVEPG